MFSGEINLFQESILLLVGKIEKFVGRDAFFTISM
jgi:hypothetical protein